MKEDELEGQNNFSIDEYLRLQKYLIELQLSGRACVFAWMNGHVDNLELKIAESKKSYSTNLYEYVVKLPPYDANWEGYYRKMSWKEYVDQVIADIEEALATRDEKVEAARLRAEKHKRERYEELKREFESND